MLSNHGCEKQQTQRLKGSGPKKGQAAKKPTKRNPASGQKGPFQKHMVEQNSRT